ncbi:hypothetical protein JCM31598_04950 [Desulfonatronum parangueonense]
MAFSRGIGCRIYSARSRKNGLDTGLAGMTYPETALETKSFPPRRESRSCLLQVLYLFSKIREKDLDTGVRRYD